MNKNQIVIESELRLLAAQFSLHESDHFYQTQDCNWSEQVKSYVIFLKSVYEEPPKVSSCSHPFYCVLPFEAENVAWLEKLKRTGFSNRAMSLDPNTRSKVLQSSDFEGDIRLKRMITIDCWDRYFQAKFCSASPFVDRSKLSRFFEFSKKRAGDFSGGWFQLLRGKDLLGRIGIFGMIIGGKLVARLQDVEIIPSKQAKGFGRQLILQALA